MIDCKNKYRKAGGSDVVGVVLQREVVGSGFIDKEKPRGCGSEDMLGDVHCLLQTGR